MKHHGSLCQSNRIVGLPKLLVHVGSSNGSKLPRLVTSAVHDFSEGDRTKYIALSYCWGNFSSFKTTTTNIHTLQTSLPLDDLPKMIHDAIIVARRLDIRCLRVDALCILQGEDHEAALEWTEDSAKMHHIYGGAFLTIAAANAASSQDGFLCNRPVTMPYYLLRSTSRYRPRGIPEEFSWDSSHLHKRLMQDLLIFDARHFKNVFFLTVSLHMEPTA